MEEKKALKKDQEICPMCEQPSTIQTLYTKNTYSIRGHEITVRESVSACTRCSERWTSTNDKTDGLEKAYTVYMKRKYPHVRKFRKIIFEGGKAYVAICSRCVDEYGLKAKVIDHIKSRSTPCVLKGCKKHASYLLSLGKL